MSNQSTSQNDINNTEFVIVIAPPGTGKTFTGDYLAVEHGYNHVDGDAPVKNTYLPQYKELGKNTFKWFMEYICKGEDGPSELSDPFHDELVRLTLEAAKTSTSNKVVLSQTFYRQVHRDYIVNKLVEAGASTENIKFVVLTVDDETKYKGFFYRSQRQLPPNFTLGDYMRMQGWQGEGDITCEEYIEYQRANPTRWMKTDGFQKCLNGIYIDVSARDMSTLDAIDNALNLVGQRADGDSTLEEILAKVKRIDQKRDEDFVANTKFDELDLESHFEQKETKSTTEKRRSSFAEEERRPSLVIAGPVE